MAQTETPEHAAPEEDRVETPYGTVTLVYASTDTARVSSGRDVGWMRLDGAQLYATAWFRKAGDTWMLDPVRSAVTGVADDKAAENAPLAVRDAAWAILRETFDSWRESRPDIAARVVLAQRAFEESRAEARIKELLGHVAELRRALPGLRASRAEAEGEVERLAAAMDTAPRP